MIILTNFLNEKVKKFLLIPQNKSDYTYQTL